jgi:subtilisin family serine protease/Ca2+-binding RTX toxin-like protein
VKGRAGRAPAPFSRNRVGSTTSSASIVDPVPPSGFIEQQLDSYGYAPASAYGSNIVSAWRYSTGIGASVALIDDGFDPATTALYGNFSTTLSMNFSGGSTTDIGEPPGGYHGTTTSGLIGHSGANGMPVGVAPNALIIGAKVAFGSSPFSTFVQALQYSSQVADIINNSWAFSGYGVGEPTNSYFQSWYSTLRSAVAYGRDGLGDVVVFAAGNDRGNADTVALQPINSNPMVIAVAASDANGQVASYSNPGPGLLVSAIGDSVAVPLPGGTSFAYGSGTSYSAPTVSGITALMLSVNSNLGWRDVQEILADSAYAPPPSAGGFTTNGATTWNGGGMQYSQDLGFGVVDANVAVNLARAWTEQSTSADQVTPTITRTGTYTVAPGQGKSTTLAVSTAVRIQQVELTIYDSALPAAYTRLTLVSPDGTQCVLLNDAGLVGTTDKTGGLDLSGSVINANAFWGENSAGTWTLQVQNNGSITDSISSWSLTFWGDNAATVQTPLVYTPEFNLLAAADPARTVVDPANTAAASIDLIALPGTTWVNLNGGAGLIDGVAVNILPGLMNASADGSTGPVTLVGASNGGSALTGGDGTTTITGYGHDTIIGGLGSTTIYTGAGDSAITLSSDAASNVWDTIFSGGGDTIWAGTAILSVINSGTVADTVRAGPAGTTIYTAGAEVSILSGGGNTISAGTGTVSVTNSGTTANSIYGGSESTTIATAGGNNAITLSSSAPLTTVDQILSGGGDTIWAGSAALDLSNTGTAADTIYGAVGATTISTEGGNFNIHLSTASTPATQDVINSGGGDTIWATKAALSVTNSGTVADTIHGGANTTWIALAGGPINAHMSTAALATTQELIMSNGGDTIWAGSAPLTLINSGTVADTVYGAVGATAISTTGGDFSIHLSPASDPATQDVIISGGDDKIWAAKAALSVTNLGTIADTVYGGVNTTSITTSGGNFNIHLSGAAALTTQDQIMSGGGDTIWAGSGNVTVIDAGANGDTIYIGKGTLTFINGSGSSVVKTGQGTVYVQAGSGGGVYHAGTGGGSQLMAGTGQVTFYGGADGDVLVAAGSANDTLIAGAGSETLSGGSTTGNLILTGGSGNDTMIAGAGKTTITVGSGNDAITIGGTADIVRVINGKAGGFDTIANFRVGVDQLVFNGYAASTPNDVIASQTSDGSGGSLLTLPDGTRIDLLGIAHATTAIFA